MSNINSPNLDVSDSSDDVKTQWNSTYLMITRLLESSSSIDQFVLYLESGIGRKEFNKKLLSNLKMDEWALIERSSILLSLFYEATMLLSGERYSTLAIVFPVM